MRRPCPSAPCSETPGSRGHRRRSAPARAGGECACAPTTGGAVGGPAGAWVPQRPCAPCQLGVRRWPPEYWQVKVRCGLGNPRLPWAVPRPAPPRKGPSRAPARALSPSPPLPPRSPRCRSRRSRLAGLPAPAAFPGPGLWRNPGTATLSSRWLVGPLGAPSLPRSVLQFP